jgi:hypothetical protein
VLDEDNGNACIRRKFDLLIWGTNNAHNCIREVPISILRQDTNWPVFQIFLINSLETASLCVEIESDRFVSGPFLGLAQAYSHSRLIVRPIHNLPIDRAVLNSLKA